MGQLERIGSSSVAQAAYERIRALILSDAMAPGDRLFQLELAHRLGVSRTPVREALRRLAGEGLVDALPQRGFRVADLGLESVMGRLEVRRLLEPGIARLAAQRAGAEDHAALEAALRDEQRAADASAIHDASRRFHVALARATGNGPLVATLEANWIVEVGRRLLARRAAVPTWQRADVHEHRTILAAVRAGDGERAARLMHEHVAEGMEHWERLAARAERRAAAG